MRFANLLVSTLAAATMLASAPAQPLPQLDALLPGQRLVVTRRAYARAAWARQRYGFAETRRHSRDL